MRTTAATIACGLLLAWTGAALAAGPAFETNLRPPVQVAGEPEVRWTLAQRMAHYGVPGLSIAVIRGGKLAWARGYGVRQAGAPEPISTETMFSVGSVSKVGAAVVALRMADRGELDIDRDVNAYLTRWKVPASAFTALRPVTLRGVFSHTAGFNLNDFPDYQPGAALPTGLDTLQGRPPASGEPARVMFTPGSRAQYSGGGTMVAQVAIEDVSGLPFAEVAAKELFAPLGMTRSTYENPLPARYGDIAKAHDGQGRPRALPRGWEAMPEMAASGLWTTPTDVAKLVIALLQSERENRADFLKPATTHQMMTEVGPSRVGIGPFLDGHGWTRRFYHSGANDSYKAWIEANLATGDGVVIFANGANGSDLLREVRRAIAVAEGWPGSEPATTPKVTLSHTELAAMAGVYEVTPAEGVAEKRIVTLSPRVSFVTQLREGSLFLKVGGLGDGIQLIPEDRAHFILANDNARRVEFVRAYDGAVTTMIYRDGEDLLEATKR